MFECTGIQQKKGSFQDDHGKTIDYDNVLIFYLTDENPEVLGFMTKELKVSKRIVHPIGFEDWEDLIGKQIGFHYNIFTGTPKLDGVELLGDGFVTRLISDHLRDTKQKA